MIFAQISDQTKDTADFASFIWMGLLFLALGVCITFFFERLMTYFESSGIYDQKRIDLFRKFGTKTLGIGLLAAGSLFLVAGFLL
jgi:di/tricarboxylate transporter